MSDSRSRFTEAELEIAKGTDLPALLESLGYRNVTARSLQRKEKDVSLSEWLTASRIRVVVIEPMVESHEVRLPVPAATKKRKQPER